MNETNLNWDDLRLFLEVARASGLAPAADRTGKSSATLGRRLLALETAMGQELVQRHARGYTLTAQGEALMRRAEAIESQITQATQSEGAAQRPIVKLSAGTWMARYLAMHINQLVFPDDQLRLRFVSTEEKLDFNHREAVIGIRNQRPTEVALAAQKVGRVHFAAYASAPDLTTWVGVEVETPSARWVRANKADRIRVEANTPIMALELAKAGAGCIVLPERIGEAEEGLKRISGTIEELSHDQWLVSHHEDRNAPHVRKVLNRVRTLLTQ
ncbi:LysR family transcriptional regulator [Cognatishimia activa]|uniref:LysR family transcriptional regulator n=1 Tax=Cognatishimia activa TaxID=1715691 RepID=UPI00222F537B|nr:LysR family transcriptional regulator [Cognatishimia activa]UZD90162.1 LysR family transcriptional regulator [Cognatishimia activa]